MSEVKKKHRIPIDVSLGNHRILKEAAERVGLGVGPFMQSVALERASVILGSSATKQHKEGNAE